MAVITKSLAEQIAIKLTEKLAQKVKDAKEALKERSFAIAKSYVPKEVLAMYQKHPDYFSDYSSVVFKGVGLDSWKYYSFTDKLPLRSQYLNINTKEAETITKADQKIDDADKALEESRSRIMNTLLGLRTYKKIVEALPEVEPYLPKETQTMAIMLPIKEVRHEIKSLLKNAATA